MAQTARAPREFQEVIVANESLNRTEVHILIPQVVTLESVRTGDTISNFVARTGEMNAADINYLIAKGVSNLKMPARYKVLDGTHEQRLTALKEFFAHPGAEGAASTAVQGILQIAALLATEQAVQARYPMAIDPGMASEDIVKMAQAHPKRVVTEVYNMLLEMRRLQPDKLKSLADLRRAGYEAFGIPNRK